MLLKKIEYSPKRIIFKNTDKVMFNYLYQKYKGSLIKNCYRFQEYTFDSKTVVMLDLKTKETTVYMKIGQDIITPYLGSRDMEDKFPTMLSYFNGLPEEFAGKTTWDIQMAEFKLHIQSAAELHVNPLPDFFVEEVDKDGTMHLYCTYYETQCPDYNFYSYIDYVKNKILSQMKNK